MNVYVTEQQQLEAIKQWFQKYGKYLLIATVIVMTIVFGWRFLQQRQLARAEQASQLYESLLAKITENDKTTSQQLANLIIDNYKETPYAAWSAMALAKYAVSQNNLPQAEQHLETAMHITRDHTIRQLAIIRLARLLSAQGKGNQALHLLTNIVDRGYLSMIESTKGDIYLAMGNREKAKIAYETTLQEYTKLNIKQPLVQMKLNQLQSYE